MTRANGCATNRLPYLDDELTPTAPAPTPPSPAAVGTCGERDRDALETFRPAPSYAAASGGRAAAQGSRCNLPLAPKPPAPVIHDPPLRGEALQAAHQKELRAWSDYAAAYEKYLGAFPQTFRDCRTLEELRLIGPEQPPKELALIGLEDRAGQLDRAWRGVLKEKVDRGAELLGEAPPGTVTAFFKANASLWKFEGEVEPSIDSRGAARVAGKLQAPGIEARYDGAEWTRSLAVSAGPVTVRHGLEHETSVEIETQAFEAKVGSDGALELKLAAAGARAGAEYDHRGAVVGGSVGVQFARQDAAGNTLIGLELDAGVRVKLVGAEDVRRALEGYFAQPKLEDAALQAQLRRRCAGRG